MNRLGLISDIHGNAVALDAVLADLASEGIDEIVCLGDIAAGGPQPREAIARLRELDCRGVRGNADGWLLEGLPPGRSNATRRLGELVAWAQTQLAADDLNYLASLPATLSLAAAGLSVSCFHGSPRSDVDSLLATTPEQELDDLLGEAPPMTIFACGHTHLQLLRSYRKSVLLNPGSVGLPLGSLTPLSECPLPAWAEYALVEVHDGDVEVAFRRLAVDVAELAAQSTAMPHRTWAADLELRIERWNRRSADEGVAERFWMCSGPASAAFTRRRCRVLLRRARRACVRRS